MSAPDSTSGSASPEPESASQGSRIAIGISFGNTNSSIAYTSASTGAAEVIANEEGDRQIPSILSYVAGEEFQGTQAKAQIVRNPRNTVAFWRDFLGKGFGEVDPSACHASARPVEVDVDVEGGGGKGKGVGFVVQEHDTSSSAEEGGSGEGEADKSTLTVSEVTTRHLRRLAQSASDYLGKPVTAAVITVPSDFSASQKSALAFSAQKAGLEVLQFIPEPIAALLAYDANFLLNHASPQNPSQSQRDNVVLVADLGGTRSDISVVSSKGGMYTTLATAHDYELGGTTLDKVLIEYAAKEFLKKNKSATDPRSDERSLAKLSLEAESVKKALSLGATASFSVESLSSGLDFSLSVNRTRYELLASKVLASFTRLINSAVAKAELDILDIDQVLLSGGTSHTPKIASNLRAVFPERTLIIAPSSSATAVNPSELAARGAAVQASLVQEFETGDIEESTEAVVTVTPHLSKAIGLVTGKEGEGFEVVVEAETPVPVRRTKVVAVKEGGDVLVRLAEGKREIRVSTAAKPTTNGKAAADSDDDDDDSDDDSDDEPEEMRTKVWVPGTVLAEAGVRGVKKGGKVEVQVYVGADMGVTVVCREVGGKGGVRGVVEGGKVEMNGSA